MVEVELVYIPLEDSPIVQLHFQMPEGATVGDVMERSQLYSIYPETKNLSVGVFSKPVTLDFVLHQGDRIEVYRPLLIDPMEKRRLRARS